MQSEVPKLRARNAGPGSPERVPAVLRSHPFPSRSESPSGPSPPQQGGSCPERRGEERSGAGWVPLGITPVHGQSLARGCVHVCLLACFCFFISTPSSYVWPRGFLFLSGHLTSPLSLKGSPIQIKGPQQRSFSFSFPRSELWETDKHEQGVCRAIKRRPGAAQWAAGAFGSRWHPGLNESQVRFQARQPVPAGHLSRRHRSQSGFTCPVSQMPIRPAILRGDSGESERTGLWIALNSCRSTFSGFPLCWRKKREQNVLVPGGGRGTGGRFGGGEKAVLRTSLLFNFLGQFIIALN